MAYRNPRLLAHVRAVKADMVARGEWRGLRGSVAATGDIKPSVGCASCGRGNLRDLTEVRSRLGPLRFCDGCLDKWEFSHRWRDVLVARLLDERARRTRRE